ncbi:MAG: 3-dehydroquinate dehydratase [Bacteroidia bacterium]|nr:3-dehydroquinate dehydratase [Bacteroidia bacterium]
MKIAVINGPNLNLIGRREPEIYGKKSFEDFSKELIKMFPEVQFSFFQSNVEGILINTIQNEGFLVDGIILNAGGYSHTSIAIADAVSAVSCPVIEVHLSNIFARETYRHNSIVGSKCKGSISGFGLNSYALAVKALL